MFTDLQAWLLVISVIVLAVVALLGFLGIGRH